MTIDNHLAYILSDKLTSTENHRRLASHICPHSGVKGGDFPDIVLGEGWVLDLEALEVVFKCLVGERGCGFGTHSRGVRSILFRMYS